MQINSDFLQPFEIMESAGQSYPFLLNSPHSGRVYPERFMAQSRLGHLAIRKSEDFLVDELFAPCVELGIPMLRACFPRAYLDVNREPYELDPSMFCDRLPEYANTKTARVSSGLGTIARIVSENQEIYRNKLDMKELDRIECYYKPYHEALRKLIAKTRIRFGCAILIDCHSMPSSSVSHHSGFGHSEHGADIVLGDRYSSSCSSRIITAAQYVFSSMGYSVAINKPFAGGYITEHYGRPAENLHTLQIEINRKLYMDEIRLEKTAGFDRLRSDLKEMMVRLTGYQEYGRIPSLPQAAE